jgi:hypothetical protein
VASETKFQVQLSTHDGQGALPKPFRISFIHVEFSDSTLNHRFEDPRPYTQNEALQSTTRELRSKDWTGRSIEWIECTPCLLEQLDGDGADETPRSAWRKTVNLDIRPFETKVLEGVIVPTKEQEIKVYHYHCFIMQDLDNRHHD